MLIFAIHGIRTQHGSFFEGGVGISEDKLFNDDIDISWHNYDVGIKEICSVFQNKTLDFLGLDLPLIVKPQGAVLPLIQAREKRVDLVFQLKDYSILHLEEEVEMDESDLIRFAQTDLLLYDKHRRTIHTVVLSITFKGRREVSLPMGSVDYHVIQVGLGAEDGEARLRKLEDAVKRGEEINEIELIMVPLMGDMQGSLVRLEKTIQLTKELKKPENEIQWMIAMELIMMNKHISRKELERHWEEVKMLKIMEYAQEKGVEKGLEKGLEKGMEKGLEKGKAITLTSTLIRLLTKRFGVLPKELKDLIHSTDADSLEVLVDGILDYQSLEDVKRLL